MCPNIFFLTTQSSEAKTKDFEYSIALNNYLSIVYTSTIVLADSSSGTPHKCSNIDGVRKSVFYSTTGIIIAYFKCYESITVMHSM